MGFVGFKGKYKKFRQDLQDQQDNYFRFSGRKAKSESLHRLQIALPAERQKA